jgi:tetratricopeptide (TPR) repeat protein
LLQQVRDAYRNGRFDIARKLLIEALERVPANDDALRAQVLADLGDVYTNEDDYPKAEQAYRKSLEIYRSAGHKTKTAMLLRSMLRSTPRSAAMMKHCACPRKLSRSPGRPQNRTRPCLARL